MRDGKQILIANRLRKRLTSLKLTSYEEYYELLVSGGTGPEMSSFIDAVSTNETYFFREGSHFAALSSTILPELFRVFPAGCGSGARAAPPARRSTRCGIVADEAARAAGAREPEIVGTDISTTVIARAREGIYHDRALRLVPPEPAEELLRARWVTAPSR